MFLYVPPWNSTCAFAFDFVGGLWNIRSQSDPAGAAAQPPAGAAAQPPTGATVQTHFGAAARARAAAAAGQTLAGAAAQARADAAAESRSATTPDVATSPLSPGASPAAAAPAGTQGRPGSGGGGRHSDRRGGGEPRGEASYGGGAERATAAAARIPALQRELHVLRLVEMGYAEDEALAALLQTDGNFEQALDILFVPNTQVNEGDTQYSQSCTPDARKSTFQRPVPR